MRIVEENWKVSHVVVSHRVAANRVAVRCGRAIARVSIAWRAIAHADAIVREPGKTGSQWRILYSIRLPGLVCDFFEVTATIGEGSGESLNRLPVGPQELILADAGYCSVAGIEYVWQHGADVLVRVNPQSFVAHSACGRRISLLPRLRTLSKAGQFGEWRVVLQGQGSWFAGRLCAVRTTDCAIQQAHRRLQRKASKKQMITRPGTLEFAKYVTVFTTRSSGSTADALRSYRMRWQIELVFKRLKSLAQLGTCPNMTTAVPALGFMGNC